MRDEIEATLQRIGGAELVADWQGVHAGTFVKPLPSASFDALAIGYAVTLGSLAAVLDVILDSSFRNDMASTHRLLDPEQQALREAAVSERMKDLGVYPEGRQPKMAMDWYEGVNQELGLRSPFSAPPFEPPDPQPHRRPDGDRDVDEGRGWFSLPPSQALHGHDRVGRA